MVRIERARGIYLMTDECYCRFLYDSEPFSIASLAGAKETVLVAGSLSKTYAMTGWRVGWAMASAPLTASIRKVHDFLTVGAPHPLQEGAVTALRFDRPFYQTLAEDYRERRDFLLRVLEDIGFRVYPPKGAYYIMTDVGHFGFSDDVACALHLVEKIGVATVPGSAFYSHPELGKTKVRFAFPKKTATLQQAAEKLRKFKPTEK